MTAEQQTQGVIFVATGQKYVEAGIKAARHINKHCKGLPIHLFTDTSGEEYITNLPTSPFSSMERLENPNPRSKVDALVLTPFDRTIFFDTDTMVVQDVREIFDLLDKFDFAMAHAMRRMSGNLKPYRIELPDAFPELNSGVMAFRRTPKVLKFLHIYKNEFQGDWQVAGARNGQSDHDQTPLRELLWLSDLQIAVLPPEYNIRNFRYPLFWGKTEAEAKVFHLKLLHKGFLPWFITTLKKLPGIKQFRNVQGAVYARFQTKNFKIPNLQQIKNVIIPPIKKHKGKKKS
jgi:hypothetical protein